MNLPYLAGKEFPEFERVYFRQYHPNVDTVEAACISVVIRRAYEAGFIKGFNKGVERSKEAIDLLDEI